MLHHLNNWIKLGVKTEITRVWKKQCAKVRHAACKYVFVCTPCCMLLRVVRSCRAKFETGQTFESTTLNSSFVPWSPGRSATTLYLFAQPLEHFRGHAPARIAHRLLLVYNVLWFVSFPRCNPGPNIVGSCCICLYTTPTRTQQLDKLAFFSTC